MDADTGADAAYADFVRALRLMQDHAVTTAPSSAELRVVARELDLLGQRLAARSVGSGDSMAGEREDLPGRGHPLLPPFTVSAGKPGEISGRLNFGPFYTGRFEITHGGAIALLFDEILGRLVNSVSSVNCRTAYLKVDYRLPVHEGAEVSFEASIDRVENRKIYAVGRLFAGPDTLAEGQGLFIKVRSN